MGIIDSIKKEKFVVISEIDPPKGANADPVLEKAEMLKGRVDALLITDMPSAVMKMSPISASCLLNQKANETICSMSCRDKNILALQGDALGAAALGIRNIYITEGEDITFGDHPKAQPVNEVTANEFLGVAVKLMDGVDSAGNTLEGAPQFNIAGCVNPNAMGEEFDNEISKIIELDKQGVSFLITAPVFDIKTFQKFVKTVRHNSNIPIIASTILLKSVATARFINMHVDGVSVPDAIIDRMYSSGDKGKESIAITADLISGFKKICQGVNLQAMGWEAKIPAYLDAAGI